MKNLFLGFSVLVFFVSCSGISRDEYDALLKENKQLKEQIEELKDTPTNLLVKGQELYANGEMDSSKSVLNRLILKYPSSPEAMDAEKMVRKIENEEREKAEQEARKKALGYKVLKESSSVSFNDLTVNFKSVSFGKRWVHDSYDDSWFYNDAERDEVFVLTKLSITSKSKNPKLPPIGVYCYEDGKLVKLAEMEYKFARWESYGCYLGNYADYGNDFSHTSTVSFSNAATINKLYQDKAIFVVVRKVGTFERVVSRFSTPEVGYTSSGGNMSSSLTVDDFDLEYQLVKIFNKNKM